MEVLWGDVEKCKFIKKKQKKHDGTKPLPMKIKDILNNIFLIQRNTSF